MVEVARFIGRQADAATQFVGRRYGGARVGQRGARKCVEGRTSVSSVWPGPGGDIEPENE